MLVTSNAGHASGAEANLSHRHHSISLRSLVIFFLPLIAGHKKKLFRHWSFLIVIFDVGDATDFCEVPVITHPPRPGQQVIVSSSVLPAARTPHGSFFGHAGTDGRTHSLSSLYQSRQSVTSVSQSVGPVMQSVSQSVSQSSQSSSAK